MDQCEIRFARVEDTDDILSIWYDYSDTLSSIDNRYEHKEDAGEQWRNYFQNQMINSSQATVIVADSNETDELLGVIEVRVIGAHPIFQLEQHGMIFGHHVRSEYQNKGIEEHLLDAAEEWFFEEKNLPFYRVNTLSENQYHKDIYQEYGLMKIESTYENVQQ